MDDFQADQFLDRWFQQRFGELSQPTQQAYQHFFNSYRMHPETGTPILLDGQSRSYGLRLLRRLRMQLAEPSKYREMLSREAKKTPEQTWGNRYLSDMHPARSLSPAELLPYLKAQIKAFEEVHQEIEEVKGQLEEERLQFFRVNLEAQCRILLSLNLWLEDAIEARLAADEGGRQACKQKLQQARWHLHEIAEAKKNASIGEKWQYWYLGDRKMDVPGVIKLTEEVLAVLSGQQY